MKCYFVSQKINTQQLFPAVLAKTLGCSSSGWYPKKEPI